MVIAAFLQDPLVHFASAGGLALLLGSAGLHKVRDGQGFARVLQGYGAAFGGQLTLFTGLLKVLVPALELLAAASVLASVWQPLAALPAALLLAFYAGVLALAARRGAAIEDCGCHWGGRPQAPSAALALRNLVLLLPALILLLPTQDRPLVWFDVISLAGALCGGLALYLLANLLVANRTSLHELNEP
ncbi:MauE/DoxX family redox-associated membrane protein [Pseudomonas sp. GCM10022186]|uniref:MauE/DoxX family redox-associated membrane protein n=1 Tax=Pseudomonas sp. GCM10022186 TaxID=3252650 RepID=UPI003613228C